MPDLEELLRADGAAWRAETDAHRPSALAELANPGRPAGRVRWRAPLAAAVITVLIAGTISYLATHGGTNLPILPALPTAGMRIDPLKPATAAEVAVARQQSRPVHRTDAVPGGDNVSEPWQFVALLNHGRTILVTYEIGDSCARPLGIRVQEGSNAVELTALSEVIKGRCEQYLLLGTTTIRLDRPLGNRLLLHARRTTR